MNFNEIYNYEILNKVLNKKNPWFDPNKNIIYIPNPKIKYKYYLECALNIKNCGRQYFILFSTNKFNSNCKNCNIDGYGRLKISIKGEILNIIKNEISSIKNIDIEYQESTEFYDVFCINI